MALAKVIDRLFQGREERNHRGVFRPHSRVVTRGELPSTTRLPFFRRRLRRERPLRFIVVFCLLVGDRPLDSVGVWKGSRALEASGCPPYRESKCDAPVTAKVDGGSTGFLQSRSGVVGPTSPALTQPLVKKDPHGPTLGASVISSPPGLPSTRGNSATGQPAWLSSVSLY
ncbi:hypothetical protein BSL78_12954 [Apostichopus japonicus]|uniref:Uncharacterized protein n=1 Tax=Stichopus japonicus TaxID=307972 RepID=A0A2G8KQ68_STIJA|nr:hypothetical protein BSL78_12954 [Apostichopus japonicus]